MGNFINQKRDRWRMRDPKTGGKHVLYDIQQNHAAPHQIVGAQYKAAPRPFAASLSKYAL